MKCAVCGEPHSFDKCPSLLDIPFLKKHFIAYCLQMNRTQKQMTAAIHQIDATWGVHDDDDDDDDDNNDGNADDDDDDDDDDGDGDDDDD